MPFFAPAVSASRAVLSKMYLSQCIAGLWFCLASTVLQAETNPLSLVPWPQTVTTEANSFKLDAASGIYVDESSRPTAEFLAKRLRKSSGYAFPIGDGSANGSHGITLTTNDAKGKLGPEGYELVVTADSVVIRAPTDAGLFYGAQTLLQLLPPEIFSSNAVADKAWQIPCCRIEDWPRFKWRGLMLDVSRHFLNKSEVETVLDAMALHKLNVFHWHLTDDQGWRVEIKKYPKLTETGAWRSGVGFGFESNTSTAYGPDGRYGGYYTQDDIREVVNYAAARHIEIVPEIEMPGHATAALAAYPQFCAGEQFAIPLTNGIFHGIFNPADANTVNFLDDVLAEVLDLFPGKFIHLGGDEVPKEDWKKSAVCQDLMRSEHMTNADQLQAWFVRRMEKTVSARGRRMVGWSEILQGDLPKEAVVMDWIGGAKQATESGHDVVMSPTEFCYVDSYQSSNHTAEPKGVPWNATITVQKVYSYDPFPVDASPQLQSHILGMQCNLWTEWIPNLSRAEDMIFPRECALAEVAWSSTTSRNWDHFAGRLQVHLRRLDKLGINYRRD